MKREKGLTIVQLMLVLLIAGVVGHFVVEYVIEKRCENNQASSLCEGRKAP
jgi:Tfp pilus assembly protein PilE